MEPNTLFDAVLDEAGASHAGLAARINALGRARGMPLRYDRTRRHQRALKHSHPNCLLNDPY